MSILAWPPQLAFCSQESAHGQVRERSQKEKNTGGQSYCDGDRRSAEAENEGFEDTLPGAVWRGIAIFEPRALISPDCLASTGESRRRSERTSAETHARASGRSRVALASAALVLAFGRARAGSEARSASASRWNIAETSLRSGHDRGDGAGTWLRVPGQAVWFLKPDCPTCDGNALEWLPFLRLAERAWRMSERMPIVRCAIYTRKSTEEGLEQTFNTLQAQR